MLLKRGSNCFSGSVKISVCFPKEDFLEVSPCLAAFVQKRWTTSGEEQRLLEEPFPKPRSGSPPGMIAVMVFSNLVFNSWVLQPPTWVSTGFFLYIWVSWGGRRGVGCICMKIQQSWEAFAPVKLATFPTQQSPAGAALRTSEASMCFLVGGAAAVAWSLGLGHGLIQVAMQTELRFCWRDHKEQGQFTTSHSFPCIFRQDKNISFYIHHYYHPDDYKDTEL